MPAFRLDESFHSHPKVVTAGNEATGLYVRLGAYAAEHLTDGFVGKDVVLLYGSSALAATLVSVRLLHRVRGGWTIHDYLDYNPSRTTVENERKSAAQRQKRWRAARASRRDNAVTNAAVVSSYRTNSGAGARASPAAPRASTPKPPWCGACHPDTRQLEDPARRCPTCHPLATGIEAQAWRGSHQEAR